MAPISKMGVRGPSAIQVICGPGMARGQKPAKAGRRGAHPHGPRLLPRKTQIEIKPGAPRSTLEAIFYPSIAAYCPRKF
jgi:hypothetical protein